MFCFTTLHGLACRYLQLTALTSFAHSRVIAEWGFFEATAQGRLPGSRVSATLAWTPRRQQPSLP